MPAVLRQPVGHRRACGAGADNDEICLQHALFPLLPLLACRFSGGLPLVRLMDCLRLAPHPAAATFSPLAGGNGYAAPFCSHLTGSVSPVPLPGYGEREIGRASCREGVCQYV